MDIMAERNLQNVKPIFKDKYYVYALCKPCWAPFYIGKGKGALRAVFQGKKRCHIFGNPEDEKEYGGRKFKNEDVILIYDDLAKGISAKELATKYSTSQQTICLIRRCEGRFKDYRDYAIEKGITQWLEVKTC